MLGFGNIFGGGGGRGILCNWHKGDETLVPRVMPKCVCLYVHVNCLAMPVVLLPQRMQNLHVPCFERDLDKYKCNW